MPGGGGRKRREAETAMPGARPALVPEAGARGPSGREKRPLRGAAPAVPVRGTGLLPPVRFGVAASAPGPTDSSRALGVGRWSRTGWTWRRPSSWTPTTTPQPWSGSASCVRSTPPTPGPLRCPRLGPPANRGLGQRRSVSRPGNFHPATSERRCACPPPLGRCGKEGALPLGRSQRVGGESRVNAPSARQRNGPATNPPRLVIAAAADELATQPGRLGAALCVCSGPSPSTPGPGSRPTSTS